MIIAYRIFTILMLSLVFNTSAQALTKETTINMSNSSLPWVRVKSDSSGITWSAFKRDGIESVGLFGLRQADAENLIAISMKAKELYKQIIDQGRCPTGKISEEIGILTSNSNYMKFKVVCEKNNILVQIAMIDEYAINVIYNYVEWQDIKKLGNAILKHYTTSLSGNADSANLGQNWTDPVTGMEFVFVPTGCYQMGSNSGGADEKPVHEVCLDGFWMGKFEVTQGQWKKIMGRNPSGFQSGEDFPVEQVSWDNTKEFISVLNRQARNSFSLPTEAQWEYAARSGGQDQIYAGGNDVNSVAWYNGNSGRKTHMIGTKTPNGLGIYDMSGNIWEWCEDVYDKNAYSKHFRNNPLVTFGSNSHVSRGGSWNYGPRNMRAAYRIGYSADLRCSDLGFRLCLSRVRQ